MLLGRFCPIHGQVLLWWQNHVVAQLCGRSDDLIYDPYTNTYLPYGEVLDRYYALMLGSVENGNHTETERLALLKYFSILYGGFEEGENSDE